MNASVLPKGKFTNFILIALTAFSAAFISASNVQGEVVIVENSSML